jgi:subfamily B ATP-binding cassette protein MsbA
MKNFLRLVSLMKSYWGTFFLAIICLIMVTICIVAFTTLVRPIFDQVWSNTNYDIQNRDAQSKGPKAAEKEDAFTLAVKAFNLEEVLPPGLQRVYLLVPVLLVVIFIIKGVFSYFGNYLMAAVGHSVVRDIRNDLYRSTIAKPISFFRRRPTGGLISRITNDVERVQYAVSTNLADLIREALTIVGLSLLIIYLNWVLALFSLVIAPVVLFPIVQFGRRLRTTSRKGQEQMEGLSNRLQETFTGIRIVKAFSAEGHERDRFRRENDHLLKVNLKANKYYSLMAPVMEVIGSVGVGFMIYWGYTQITAGAMTVGDFGVILAALYGMYNPIKKLSNVNSNLQQAFAAIERISELLDIKEEILESPEAVPIPLLQSDIKFRNVSFSYSKRTILKDISFDVPKGTVCAIVGLSGAGKTTLVNLLPRFDEVTEGAILVDDVDIRRFTLNSLRDSIGIVTQDVILFNDSVRNNIAYGDANSIAMDKIIEAAEAAYARDFILRLPEGYETVIGEKGVTLSGGEKQRLAIARALLRNPPILILDEATSSLDSESERLVQSALDNLMARRTTFVIAHRLSTVRKAGMIIVLNEGRIVERGRHEELIKADGIYSKLYSLQFAEDLKTDSPPELQMKA